MNYSSPEWKRVPTNIIDKDIKYFRSTGVGEVGQRISNYFQEAGREVFGFDPMDAEGTELVKADRDINTLRETILMEMTNWQDDRVLKTAQDALRETMVDLTPGIFRTDEGALATLQAVKGSLGRAFSNYANLDPYYNPAAFQSFEKREILEARQRLIRISSLMAEVLALEGSYKGYLESLAPGGPINNTGEKNLSSTRAMLNRMQKANKGG